MGQDGSGWVRMGQFRSFLVWLGLVGTGWARLGLVGLVGVLGTPPFNRPKKSSERTIFAGVSKLFSFKVAVVRDYHKLFLSLTEEFE
jgi:hypothetical protein